MLEHLEVKLRKLVLHAKTYLKTLIKSKTSLRVQRKTLALTMSEMKLYTHINLSRIRTFWVYRYYEIITIGPK